LSHCLDDRVNRRSVKAADVRATVPQRAHLLVLTALSRNPRSHAQRRCRLRWKSRQMLRSCSTAC